MLELSNGRKPLHGSKVERVHCILIKSNWEGLLDPPIEDALWMLKIYFLNRILNEIPNSIMSYAEVRAIWAYIR